MMIQNLGRFAPNFYMITNFVQENYFSKATVSLILRIASRILSSEVA